jgi:hypothetical protein
MPPFTRGANVTGMIASFSCEFAYHSGIWMLIILTIGSGHHACDMDVLEDSVVGLVMSRMVARDGKEISWQVSRYGSARQLSAWQESRSIMTEYWRRCMCRMVSGLGRMFPGSPTDDVNPRDDLSRPVRGYACQCFPHRRVWMRCGVADVTSRLCSFLTMRRLGWSGCN